MNLEFPYLDELVDFHGHMCPGLAIGYRATIAGLSRLGIGRARDEEVLAIVENDSCSVDAVQFLAGATFGKGNLFFRDWGKQVFTFARRDQETAVRVALRWGSLDSGEAGAAESGQSAEDSRRRRTEMILGSSEDDLFVIREVKLELPPQARIFKSVQCECCGEPAMETRLVKIGGKEVCMDCARQLEPGMENGL